MIDINDIEKQVQAALQEKIEAELNTYDLYYVIEQQINLTVQDKVNATITGLLNRLINNETVAAQVNTHMSLDIQEKLDQAVQSRVASTVAQTDLGTEISKGIAKFVQERMLQAALPENFIPAKTINWDHSQLPADRIGAGTINNFSSNGIEDHAIEVNLTVLDGQVVIENETVTKQLTVVDSASIKNLSVGKIVVNDGIVINDGKFAEQIRGLIDSRISHRDAENNWDTNGKPLQSNRTVLIDNNSLGNSIVESNLRKVGRLTSLSVTGITELADTVYINNGRLGVNTEEPAGVFTAWDEESELTVRKYKNRTMYVGSSRDSELVLGVGGDAVLSIRRSGVETNSIKIGNISISSGNSEPKRRGSPGDLVVNESAHAGQPWAWRCTGGETWVPLN
jgi:hypothetical protein